MMQAAIDPVSDAEALEAALKKFQEQHTLMPDGCFGARTLQKLRTLKEQQL